jgi:hypothetical protein
MIILKCMVDNPWSFGLDFALIKLKTSLTGHGGNENFFGSLQSICVAFSVIWTGFCLRFYFRLEQFMDLEIRFLFQVLKSIIYFFIIWEFT